MAGSSGTTRTVARLPWAGYELHPASLSWRLDRHATDLEGGVSYTPQASGVIHAECASKANSRRHVTNASTGKSMFIKSKPALDFMAQAVKDIFRDYTGHIIEGPVQLSCRIFYSSRRPDLDAALVMDALQAAQVIDNDRQVWDLHATKLIDAANPRVEWSVRQIPEPTPSA